MIVWELKKDDRFFSEILPKCVQYLSSRININLGFVMLNHLDDIITLNWQI